MVGAGRIAVEHSFDEGHALADRHRRQVDPVGDVAHGIDGRNRGLGILVHQDFSALAELHADPIEAQIRGVGLASGGVQNGIDLVMPAVGAFHPQAALCLFDFHNIRSDMQVDALFAHLVGDVAPHLSVKAAQNLLAAIELRHLGPHAVKDAGELAGNISAAHHHYPLWQVRQVKYLVRGDHMFRTVDTGHERRAARGNEDVLGSEGLAARQRDRMRIGDHGARLVECDTDLFHISLIDAFQTLYFPVLGGDQLRPVERGLAHGPAEPPGILEGRRKLGGIDHQLFRNAAADHAGAAPAVFLGNRHSCAGQCRHARGPNSAGAASDDKKVVVECH